MCLQQFHSLGVSKSRGNASRVLQIGKHDRTRGRIKRGGASGVYRRRIRNSSQERLDRRGIDFDDLVGNAPVSFVMDFLNRIPVGSLHQAKRLSSRLVMPIGYETDAILALDCQILYMRRDNVLASETFRVVAVHVNRHLIRLL